MTSPLVFRTACGLLLGVLAAGLSINSLPLAGRPLGEQAAAAIPFVLAWCVSGIAGAHLAFWLQPRLPATRFTLVMAAALVALAAAVTGVLLALPGLGVGGPALAAAASARTGLSFQHSGIRSLEFT